MNRILAGLAMCLAAAQDAPPAAPPAVARDRLPVLGTVGDLPPEKERVIVELKSSAPGTLSLHIGGKDVGLAGFLDVVSPLAEKLQAGTGNRLNVVLRVDRGVHWGIVEGVLGLLPVDHGAVRRVFFAAVPEDGGEEGAMALFLPRTDAPDDPDAVGPRFLSVRLRSERGSAAPGPILHRRIAGREGPRPAAGFVADLDVEPDVAAGAVLESVDSLLRAGVRGVALGIGARTEGLAKNPATGWPLLEIEGVAAEGPAGPPVPLPAVGRVHGRIAGQVESPPSPYLGSPVGIGTGGNRHRRTERFRLLGLEGGLGTEAAVDAALDWLSRHQSKAGSWDADGFEANCHGAKCGGPGGPLYDPGVTGLALLAFLGTGETHKTAKHGHVLRLGLKYMKGIQDAEGCFGPRLSNHFAYNHSIATLAMVDAYWQTKSPLFQQSAQNGLAFIQQCQNPYLAWRYGVKPQDNDTSVTAWMVWALDAGRDAELTVDPDAFKGAQAWLDRVTDPVTGRAGYTARGNGPARPQELMDRFPAHRSESLTALAVLTRMHCGAGRDDPMVAKGLDLLGRVPPAWNARDGSIDFYYWHYGTMAMFQAGGERWRHWNDSMKEALVSHQRRGAEEDARGSWDPVDPWATEEGRVGATALNALTLETYFRYRRNPPAK